MLPPLSPCVTGCAGSVWQAQMQQVAVGLHSCRMYDANTLLPLSRSIMSVFRVVKGKSLFPKNFQVKAPTHIALRMRVNGHAHVHAYPARSARVTRGQTHDVYVCVPDARTHPSRI